VHSELHDWIALRLTPGIGNVACKNLLEAFGTPKRIFTAPVEKLTEIAGISPKIIETLRCSSKNPEIEHELEKLAGSDIRIVAYNEPEYPQTLKNIYDPPPYLYIRGKLEPEDCNAIAVVGSRRASDYGLRAASDISRELARNG